MSTLNRRHYDEYFAKGKEIYAKVLEQKNLKTKIKMGNEAIELFNKAMALSKIVNQTEKDEYMWEYICLIHGVIATDYYESHQYDKAIEYITMAQKENRNTLINEETVIRDLFFLEKLMAIAIEREDFTEANKKAREAIDITKRLMGIEKAILYLDKIKAVFIITKDVEWIQKTFDIMLKSVKGTKREFSKIKASVFVEYGQYAHTVLKNDKEAKKYLLDAKKDLQR